VRKPWLNAGAFVYGIAVTLEDAKEAFKKRYEEMKRAGVKAFG
jgi:hypothetical protein